MNTDRPADFRRSPLATGGLLLFGALIVENLALLSLLFHPDAPALRAVIEALFKAIVIVMMHDWPLLILAGVGVALLTGLGLTSLGANQPLPEDGR